MVQYNILYKTFLIDYSGANLMHGFVICCRIVLCRIGVGLNYIRIFSKSLVDKEYCDGQWVNRSTSDRFFMAKSKVKSYMLHQLNLWVNRFICSDTASL